MSEPQYILMPQPLGLYAGELIARGIEYLDAFEVLAGSGKPKQPYASYFLYAHSMELILKSYLAASRVPKTYIKNQLRHNLPKILDECDQRSLPEVTNLRAAAERIYDVNENYEFRYPPALRPTLPYPQECLSVARALVAAVGPFVEQERVNAELLFASDTRHHRGKKVRWSD